MPWPRPRTGHHHHHPRANKPLVSNIHYRPPYPMGPPSSRAVRWVVVSVAAGAPPSPRARQCRRQSSASTRVPPRCPLPRAARPVRGRRQDRRRARAWPCGLWWRRRSGLCGAVRKEGGRRERGYSWGGRGRGIVTLTPQRKSPGSGETRNDSPEGINSR